MSNQSYSQTYPEMAPVSDRTVSKFQLLSRRYLTRQRQIKTDTDCRSTWRDRDLAVTLEYGECSSVDTYKPKFCTTCKKSKCCGPGRTKSRAVAFRCPDGKRITEQFMWISSCECKASKTCPYTILYEDGVGRQ